MTEKSQLSAKAGTQIHSFLAENKQQQTSDSGFSEIDSILMKSPVKAE